MKKVAVITFGLSLVGLISSLPSYLVAYTGEKLAKGAKIGIEQARAIALRSRAGAITDEELEREKGGRAFVTPSTSRATVRCMKSEWMRRLARSSKTRRRVLTQIEDDQRHQ